MDIGAYRRGIPVFLLTTVRDKVEEHYLRNEGKTLLVTLSPILSSWDLLANG